MVKKEKAMTDELKAIRERIEYDWHDASDQEIIDTLHSDAADLLRLLDAARAELAEIRAWADDDQLALTAAVTDAMWHWDDMPMDCDDAISLASTLKDSLRNKGLQIVRLAAAVENKND